MGLEQARLEYSRRIIVVFIMARVPRLEGQRNVVQVQDGRDTDDIHSCCIALASEWERRLKSSFRLSFFFVGFFKIRAIKLGLGYHRYRYKYGYKLDAQISIHIRINLDIKIDLNGYYLVYFHLYQEAN